MTQDIIHFHYISESSELSDLIQKLYDVSVVAMDMEADSFHHYYPKVCLIQISFDSQNYIVDPLVGLDLLELMRILALKKLIFHDSGYDLRMLRQCYQFHPKGDIFDTMLAGKLLGAKSLSLAGMLDSFLGVSITKGSQKADWSKRPLPQHLLQYAVMDTYYLLELANKLEVILQEQNRTGWHKQMCRQFVKAAMNHTHTADSEKDWRIKGYSRLTPRQLAFLKQLWLWREKQAQVADLPAFRILHNERLVSLAIGADAKKKPDFIDICVILKHLKGKRMESLLSALEKAFALRPNQWPQARSSARTPRPDAPIMARIEKIHKICQTIAETHNLSTEMILSRSLIGKIAQSGLEGLDKLVHDGSILPWQADLLRKPLAEILPPSR